MNFIELIAGTMALIVLEIILGIDNLIFLSILIEPLPAPLRRRVRYWGLSLAWVARLLLLSLSLWLVKLQAPVFYIAQKGISIRDMFLLCGGMFLIYKATQEMGIDLRRVASSHAPIKKKKVKLPNIVCQLVLMDLVFSIDSVFTAVGITPNFWIMLIGITVAIFVMLYASESVSKFIETYPALKILALSFLMLVGTLLVADGLSFHVPRGYLYFTMTFSCFVEWLNIRKGART